MPHRNACFTVHGRQLLVARVSSGRPVAMSPRKSGCHGSARTAGSPAMPPRAKRGCRTGRRDSSAVRGGPALLSRPRW